MKIFWTYNDIPEFKELSKDERKISWNAIYKSVPRTKLIIKALLLTLLFCGAGVWLGYYLYSEYPVLPKSVMIGIFAGVGSGIGSFIYTSYFYRYSRPYIEAYFKNQA